MSVIKTLYLAILILMFSITTVSASCFRPYYTFTEVLANKEDTKHIFTCEVIATYISGRDGYTSLAVVKERFRGNPLDTVYIASGGFSSQRGDKLSIGSEWLIISDVRYNQQYTATICENLSQQLSDGGSACKSDKAEFGPEYLALIKLFHSLEKSKFSGEKKLAYKGEVRAIGGFLNGKAHGNWKHYEYGVSNLPGRLRSEIDYQYGKIEGLEIRYARTSKDSLIDFRRKINNGKVQWQEERFSSSQYSFPNDSTQTVTYTRLDANRDTTWLDNSVNFFIDSDRAVQLGYSHGPYFRIDVINGIYGGSGTYYKGALVGDWVIPDKTGNLTQEVSYPYPDTSDPSVFAFKEDGSPSIVRTLIDGGSKVKWKHYSKHCEEEWILDEDNRLVSSTLFQYKFRRTVTPYKNGKPDGTIIAYDTLDRIFTKTDVSKGILHGKHIEFDTSGNITLLTNYKNRRGTTIVSNSSDGVRVDGFTHGLRVFYGFNGTKKVEEGEYWMGYLVGKHHQYNHDGSYSISYYPTDHQTILQACNNNGPFKIEHYDENGQLTETLPK